jgi:N-acetylglucosaminyl-diphospho-decaprenol L-rhamnosyltransferase
MLTIIIVAWNCREEVLRCLESLEQVGRLSLDFETLVVQSRESAFANIGLEVIRNSRNVGLSAATEQAYSRASGDWILLCNPDILFNRDAGKLLSYGLSNPYEMVTVELVNYDGTPQRVIHRRFPTVTRVYFDFGLVGSYIDEKVMNHLVRKNYAYQDEILPSVTAIEQPGGSFLLLNRTIINKLGFIYDRLFPVWWNDVDLAKRAEAAGIRRTLMTDVQVRHGLGRSGSRRMASSVQWRLFCKSMFLYARRWKMHPRLIQLLFSIDAIAFVPLSLMVQSKSRGLRTTLKRSISLAAAQMSGVLGA